MVARLMPPIVRGCAPERFARAKDFFADPAHPLPGAGFVLARTGDAVEDCVRMARRDGARFEQYLRGAAGAP
jgi:hypothetical protein